MIQEMVMVLGEGDVGDTGDTVGTAIAEPQVGVAGSVDGKLAVGGQRGGSGGRQQNQIARGVNRCF